MVIETLQANAVTAQKTIAELVSHLPVERGCECGAALATAIINPARGDSSRDPCRAGAAHRQVPVMSQPVLTVGSVAFDSIRTPFGEVSRVVGGAATFFSIAASFFSDVRLVAVVGEDFDERHVQVFGGRRIDLEGLQRVPGDTFRWKGEYKLDLNTRETILHAPERIRGLLAARAGTIPFHADRVSRQHPPGAATGGPRPDRGAAVRRTRYDELLDRRDPGRAAPGAAAGGRGGDQRRGGAATEREGEPGEGGAARSAPWVPRRVIVKRGEHGVLLTRGDDFFAAPGLPLEEVCDPTGAGDTFAGGFIGYLAAAGDFSDDAVTRAAVCGSALASLSVEDFGLGRLLTLTDEDIRARFDAFRRLTHFDALAF